jgi:hypothetical protein
MGAGGPPRPQRDPGLSAHVRATIYDSGIAMLDSSRIPVEVGVASTGSSSNMTVALHKFLQPSKNFAKSVSVVTTSMAAMVYN